MVGRRKQFESRAEQQPPGRSPGMGRHRFVADAASAAVSSGVYWLSIIAWSTPLGLQISASAWFVLFMVCAAVTPAAWRLGRGWSARVWLYVAGCTLIAAAGFYGANQGLDALHGAGRRKADVASHLGGLELWFVLVPGVFSVCLGAALRAFLRGALRPGKTVCHSTAVSAAHRDPAE